MKKLLLSAAVIAATVLSLSGCKKNQTPITDTTKLWPAYDANTEKYGYIDNKGQFKIPAIYDDASNFFSCGYAVVTMGESQSFIDTKGNVKYTTQNGELDPFYYNYAVVYENSKYGLMNRSFKYSIYSTFDVMGNMSADGLIVAQAAGANLLGFYDAKGNVKISPLYKSASGFLDGHAAVTTDGERWGIIDKSGKFTVQPTYDHIYALGAGRWSAYSSKSNGYTLIDAKGTTKGFFKGLYGSYDNEPIFTVRNDQGKYGVIDGNGKQLIPYQYDGIDDFCEGVCAAYNEGNDSETMFLIDKKGNVLYSESNADAETPMHNGLILVSTYNSKTGKETYKWMDKKGQMIYSWTFDGYRAPARAPKVGKNNEWTPEPFFVLK